MPARTRNAYICQHASHDIPPRRFFPKRPTGRVTCADGHEMVRQRNVPYRRPDPEARPTIGRRVDPPARPAKTAARRARSQR